MQGKRELGEDDSDESLESRRTLARAAGQGEASLFDLFQVLLDHLLGLRQGEAGFGAQVLDGLHLALFDMGFALLPECAARGAGASIQGVFREGGASCPTRPPR
ncbi:MAG: hypothetical protein UZ18_ATM001002519 [Armatimonadetes bacterium OLB18]|nr:MAG: hypothetical protein UZ18_ATM001002519 [Armatimonadetes bacterium OLB18]